MQVNNRHVLRLPLIVLTSVVLGASVLLGFAYQYSREQDAVLQHAKSTYNSAQQQLQFVEQKQQTLAQYLPQYRSWQAIGLIGEERRQQWIARLHQVQTQQHLFNINYDISQQQTYNPRFIANTSHHDSRRYDLRRSVMVLELALLHTGDLLKLLTGLRENTSPFMVRDCEVHRIKATESNASQFEGRLQARCEIDWLTLKELRLQEQHK